jgi:nitrogen fixation protein NifU and related proteins
LVEQCLVRFGARCTTIWNVHDFRRAPKKERGKSEEIEEKSTMSGRLILDHFRNPRNAGELERPDGLGIEKDNPWLITIQMALTARNGIIEQVRFKAQGCVTSIASCSMLTELVHGQTLPKALSLSDFELSEALGTIPEEKIHCCRLAISALHKAIDDFYRQQGHGSVLACARDCLSDTSARERGAR